MTLPSWQYGNPINVMLRAESRTCKGCCHEKSMFISMQKVNYCDKGKTHSDQQGSRCNLYRERD